VPASRRPLFVLLAAVFVDRLDFGVLIPILPLLLADPTSDYFLLSGPESIDTGYVLLGLIGGAYAISAFLVAPVLGQLADKYGRKPLLLVAFGGSAASYVIFGLGIVMESIPLLFASRILDGVTGGNVLVAQSALADLTEPDDRARVFGYFSAMLSLGFVVGPLAGGLLGDPDIVSWFTPALPFWIAAAMGTVNLVLIVLMFEETLEEPQEDEITASLAFERVREAFRMPTLRAAYLTELLFLAGFTFFTSFFNVLLVERLGYDQSDIGVFFTALGTGFFLVQTTLVEPIRSRLGPVWTLRVALFGIAATITATAFVQQTWQLYALIPFFALTNGVVGPNLVALISNRASDRDQGRVLGIRSSVQSLGRSGPPLVAGPLAAWGSAATPILVGGALAGVAALTFTALIREGDVAYPSADEAD
jgi:DHA1 family tetracycline resistance protein-like MFS transporter